MTSDEERAFAVVVRPVSEGDWTVSAEFFILYRANQYLGKEAHIYASISEDNSTISYSRPIPCPRTVQFAPGVNQRGTIQSSEARFGGEISFSAPPILGSEVELTLLLTPKQDFLSGRVDMNLQELGFEFVTGTRTWEGAFSAGEQIEFTYLLRVLRPGEWTFGADIFGSDGQGGNERVRLTLYPYVTEDGAMVGNIEPYDCLRPGPAPSTQVKPNSR